VSDLITARSSSIDPWSLLRQRFGPLCRGEGDALWGDSSRSSALGLCGLPYSIPLLRSFLADAGFVKWLGCRNWPRASFLLVWEPSSESLLWHCDLPGGSAGEFPATLLSPLRDLLRQAPSWAGTLDREGVHCIDLRTPSPGPHFHSNLLIGRRESDSRPLQTTPKSVVDRLGRGSFRSHSATQVLATRWDLRQEENGFPANRQFYLTEDERQIFYSASPAGQGLAQASCRHGQNWTRIRYRTTCGLEIERLIFILPQEPGLPMACEVQEIAIRNRSERRRNLRLVYTGMFGPAKPQALMEDVLYSAITLQAAMVANPDGSILALSPDYCPVDAKVDRRFQVLALHQGSARSYPREFCTDYQEFVGNGTLEYPEGVLALPNRLSRKGPGFFALGVPVPLMPGESAFTESFTGLCSTVSEDPRGSPDWKAELRALVDRYDSPEAVRRALDEQGRYFDRYAGFVKIKSGRPSVDVAINRNLPFQVYYQTFASRSFCQTQKGYREIGFREIQDLLASMPYFFAAGLESTARDLIGEWASHIHRFGYADHNFYWRGKEPGEWSDDALWLVQAVALYAELAGEDGLLDREFPVAGSEGARRSLYLTLQAIVRYSGELSLGAHGLPLLDRADWNDCLRLDRDYLDGPRKEARYNEQVARGEIADGAPLASDYSESVMNAFLLKRAADLLSGLAARRGDAPVAAWASSVAGRMAGNCRSQAWRDNYYCRLLLNRHPEFPYVGASGDGLATDGADGSYYLNSFSWSILSGVADEEQVRLMFELLETRLRTEQGYLLVSPSDLRRIDPSAASAEYFRGDRENGAVFKHASMMAVMALLEAASSVADGELARRLAAAAWWMIDLALPGRTMSNPYVLAGNPRFCTQYANGETGEHIGPLLSGTASWLTLCLHRAYGIALRGRWLVIDPLLRESDQEQELALRLGDARYRIAYRKPGSFVRIRDRAPEFKLDGSPLPDNRVPLVSGARDHLVEVTW
jgi:cellobiose phosphorylase